MAALRFINYFFVNVVVVAVDADRTWWLSQVLNTSYWHPEIEGSLQ